LLRDGRESEGGVGGRADLGNEGSDDGLEEIEVVGLGLKGFEFEGKEGIERIEREGKVGRGGKEA